MGYFRCGELEKLGDVTAFYTGADVQIRKGCFEDYVKCGMDFGFEPENIIVTRQNHTTDIEVADREYLEKIKNGDIKPDRSVDGYITDVPEILLCSYEADCVPVYFYDPVRKAAGMIHSGWRGTANCIPEKAAEMMKARFGCRPDNIYVLLGPHICGECYEVGGELIPEFEKNFGRKTPAFFREKAGGKYLLNMSSAVKFSLERAGIPSSNIYDTKKCTYACEDFNSFRRTGDITKRMMTAIGLRDYDHKCK